jgi:hypothetical protein
LTSTCLFTPRLRRDGPNVILSRSSRAVYLRSDGPKQQSLTQERHTHEVVWTTTMARGRFLSTDRQARRDQGGNERESWSRKISGDTHMVHGTCIGLALGQISPNCARIEYFWSNRASSSGTVPAETGLIWHSWCIVLVPTLASADENRTPVANREGALQLNPAGSGLFQV